LVPGVRSGFELDLKPSGLASCAVALPLRNHGSPLIFRSHFPIALSYVSTTSTGVAFTAGFGADARARRRGAPALEPALADARPPPSLSPSPPLSVFGALAAAFAEAPSAPSDPSARATTTTRAIDRCPGTRRRVARPARLTEITPDVDVASDIAARGAARIVARGETLARGAIIALDRVSVRARACE
jgi:hypothetical protein